jgi:signal transduction histidine kinase
MLGRVAERIVTALHVTYCRIGLVQDGQPEGGQPEDGAGCLTFRAAYPIRDLAWEPAISRQLTLGETPVHRAVLATGRPQLVELDVREPTMSPEERDAAWLRPATSVLLLPMCQGDTSIGLIQIGEARRTGRSPITPEQIELAQAMAAQIGVAVTNAHLHQARVEAERAVRALNEQLEQRVRERTRELEAANQELEAFSYSVSHDLRAPLRAMDGFSRILLERHADGFTDDARGYLDRIRGSAQRMSQLIDDLLTFARMSRKPVARRTVDLADVVREVLAELSAERQNRPLVEEIRDLPICQADPTLMKQVYVNLLQNALKFTRRRNPAKIEIGAQTVDGEVVYYVKDNGAGFDMQYADKLFGVFQRLHRPTDFEGTGVGLAICQRIIHRHGGRIWAEAAPEQGAAFFFTIGAD